MREIVSSVPPTDSRVLMGAFAVLSLVLLWIGRSIAVEALGVADPTILGVNVAIGFAIVAVMAVLYYRLTYPHRIVLEADEDLW